MEPNHNDAPHTHEALPQKITLTFDPNHGVFNYTLDNCEGITTLGLLDLAKQYILNGILATETQEVKHVEL